MASNSPRQASGALSLALTGPADTARACTTTRHGQALSEPSGPTIPSGEPSGPAPRAFLAPTALLLGALLLPQVAAASDHIDGPVTTDDPVTDLVDLYAFPTPERPGYLSLVLNVYPFVRSTGHFSEKVDYEFLIRRARPRTPGRGLGFETAGDYAITCSFETPHGPFAKHHVLCRSSAGASVEAEIEAIAEATPGEHLRVFAGRRSDPFFINTAWFSALGERGVLKEPTDNNGLKHTNVLTLALEINVAAERLSQEGSLLAIAAQSMTTDALSGEIRRLDRLGRPEVTNILMLAHDEPDLRPRYNAEEPFATESARHREYRERLRENIDWHDAADGTRHWPTIDRDALAELFLNDYLLVNPRTECTRARYFEIERAVLESADELGCGGRSLDDDIIDDLYTLLVNRGQGPRIRDGADQATRPPTATFPYLAAPSEGVYPALLGFIQGNGARVQQAGHTRWRGLMNFAAAIFAALSALTALILALRLAIGRARARELSSSSSARSFGIIGLFLGLSGTCVIASGSSSLTTPTLLTLGCSIALALRARHAQ